LIQRLFKPKNNQERKTPFWGLFFWPIVWGLGLVGGGWRVKGLGIPTKDTPYQKPNFASNLFSFFGLPLFPFVGRFAQTKREREEGTQKRGKKIGHLFLGGSINRPTPTNRQECIENRANPPKNGSINTFSPTPTTSDPLTQFDKMAKIGYLFDAVFRLFLVSKMRLKKK